MLYEIIFVILEILIGNIDQRTIYTITFIEANLILV